MLCSGKCGREGLGPFDSGDPDLDKRYTWCNECWGDLARKRMPPGLAADVPAAAYVPYVPHPPPVLPHELSSLDSRHIEHKIMPAAEAKSVATIAAGPVTDTGSGTFTGYLAAFGRDFGGDQLMPGSMDDTAAALNSGAIQWFLTDSHSEKASDIVAAVTAAVVDHYGLRIAGQWMPDEIAQKLRRKVQGGAKLGLSIDYLTDASRPDGKGGRLLDRITVVGGAVTPHPMNPGAFITESKYAAAVPIVDVYTDVQARHRASPEREAEDRLLAAASWPPRHFDRETRLALLRGAGEAKARRELAADTGRARERARRDQDNRYSSDLAAWMAANR